MHELARVGELPPHHDDHHRQGGERQPVDERRREHHEQKHDDGAVDARPHIPSTRRDVGRRLDESINAGGRSEERAGVLQPREEQGVVQVRLATRRIILVRRDDGCEPLNARNDRELRRQPGHGGPERGVGEEAPEGRERNGVPEVAGDVEQSTRFETEKKPHHRSRHDTDHLRGQYLEPARHAVLPHVGDQVDDRNERTRARQHHAQIRVKKLRWQFAEDTDASMPHELSPEHIRKHL